MTFEETVNKFTHSLDRLSNLIEKVLEDDRQASLKAVVNRDQMHLDLDDGAVQTPQEDQSTETAEARKPKRKGRPAGTKTRKRAQTAPSKDSTAAGSAPKKRRKRRTKAEMEAARRAEAEAKQKPQPVEQEPVQEPPEVDDLSIEDSKSLFREALELGEKLSDEEVAEAQDDELSEDDEDTLDVAKAKEETAMPLMDVPFEDEEEVKEQNNSLKVVTKISKTDLRDLLQKLMKFQLGREARLILASFGVNRAADLSPEQVDEAYHKLASLLPSN